MWEKKSGENASRTLPGPQPCERQDLPQLFTPSLMSEKNITTKPILRSHRSLLLLPLLLTTLLCALLLLTRPFALPSTLSPANPHTVMSTPNNNDASTPDISTYAAEYQSLRTRKGHFGGGEHDVDVDKFNGRKHVTMKHLAETLGVKGTPAVKVLEAMGAPDEIVPKSGGGNIQAESVGPLDGEGLATGMPGPVLGGGEAGAVAAAGAGETYYLVYYWRGRHDYVWFLVGAKHETVEGYGWYAAGD
ncbi:uncharacterized protein EV422DRAFT_534382 [Fimicolochytrium jonesii]|uniref:uncharacterized protein n=1 Tax=Fimicolochytrium jonesii TaxID=1396493 RepID=UPI0022FF3429|nr:uncharacterized protein EV422DRAFT_534382 [Fimicolochytrium jonesii]KAI8819334.1 hypothetical protein EV422DRAFT_534382 [Fimicolochytrium jonesii]